MDIESFVSVGVYLVIGMLMIIGMLVEEGIPNDIVDEYTTLGLFEKIVFFIVVITVFLVFFCLFTILWPVYLGTRICRW